MAFDNVRDRNRAIAIAAGAAVGGALCCYGYSQVQQRLPPWRKQQALLRQYADTMLPSKEKMQALQDDILKQMKDSLAKKGAASILMLPTYVLRLPDGTERGATFAIDIGGTNFRCYYCELGDKKGVVVKEDMEIVSIPRDVLTGQARQLFDFLAINLAAFISKHSDKVPPGERPVVGFGFSFPMDQQALNSGVLMKWTKGFDVNGVVNKDVVPLLSDALERANCPCRVTVVLNDTVAVLAGARYLEPATSIGVILGTGTNAAIEVPVRDMAKWKPSGVSPDALTAVNTEWGCYGSPLLPRVQEDFDLDNASVQKGAGLIEKMMSGMYLGEVARRVLLMFAQKAQLFGSQVPQKLQQEGSFTTAMLSEVESDATPLRWRAYRVLSRELGVPTSALRLETLIMAQAICRLVVRRSARVMAHLLGAVLRLQGWDKAPHKTVVAVDGGVILKYANWRRYNRQYLAEALGPQGSKLSKLVVFRPAADASSFGGAVLAAAAAEEEDAHAGQRSPSHQASKSPSRKAAPEPATPPASGHAADPAPTA